MILRKKLTWICAAALAVTAVALVFAAGVAHGSEEPAKRGAACISVGEHRANRSGIEYVCEQRAGDLCPVWHAAHPTKGPWPKPSPCACPSKSTSSAPPVDSSPSASKPAVSTSPALHTSTTPVAAELPVTGTPTVVGLIAVIGLLSVLAGGAILVETIRRRDI